MKQSNYLYGVEPIEFKNLKYINALDYKIKAANELLTNLFKTDFMLRDNHRINDVLKAIKFNQELLEELIC